MRKILLTSIVSVAVLVGLTSTSSKAEAQFLPAGYGYSSYYYAPSYSYAPLVSPYYNSYPYTPYYSAPYTSYYTPGYSSYYYSPGYSSYYYTPRYGSYYYGPRYGGFYRRGFGYRW